MAQMQHQEVPALIGYWITNLRVTSTMINGLAAGPAGHFAPGPLWQSA